MLSKQRCSFHNHSGKSDGTHAPEALVTAAYQAGVRIMSITDHNYTEDLTKLREYAASTFDEEMTLIQGAEISAAYTDENGSKHELHIIGLGFDPNHPSMKAMLASHMADRKKYVTDILKRLKEDCGGIDLGDYESILAQFPEKSYIGRMTLAELLTQKGFVSSVDDAFDRYLKKGRSAYVVKDFHYSPLEKVVKTILESGGTPILCHLLEYGLDGDNRTGGEEKEQVVRRFRELLDAYGGKGGMEVYYTKYQHKFNDPEKDMAERLYLLRLAQKYGLLISAGSDFHGQQNYEGFGEISACACSDLLAHLGIPIRDALPPAQLYVMSGYSGVGKGTICKFLKNRQIGGKPVALIQSYTNRAPCGEDDPYTFVTREEFTAMAQNNKFLEFNNAYAQNGYGTPLDDVVAALEKNQAVLLEIDRTGLMHLLTDGKINPNLVKSVFIAAEAVDVATRLYLRGTETQPQIERRLETAVKESHHLDLYDAVIVNHVVEDTCEAVIDVFEGRLHENTFDSAKFRADMKQVLTAYWRRFNGLRYDPVEDTAQYKKAMKIIEPQLAREFPANAPNAEGCPEVWNRKHLLLKAQGIHWRTPEEMNPEHQFR